MGDIGYDFGGENWDVAAVETCKMSESNAFDTSAEEDSVSVDPVRVAAQGRFRNRKRNIMMTSVCHCSARTQQAVTVVLHC